MFEIWLRAEDGDVKENDHEMTETALRIFVGLLLVTEKGESMRLSVVTPVLVLLSTFATAFAATEGSLPDPPAELLRGDRILLGTVEEIAGDQARINTGEVEPRYIPTNVRKAKELPVLKKGDHVEITVNDQNLLVDVHVVGEASHHLVVHGQLTEPLATGHQKAMIRNTHSGKDESYSIRPVARSKVASIPIGVDAVFLIDELGRIADVTYGSAEAVHHAARLWQRKLAQ
jgi:hypothetical protein